MHLNIYHINVRTRTINTETWAKTIFKHTQYLNTYNHIWIRTINIWTYTNIIWIHTINVEKRTSLFKYVQSTFKYENRYLNTHNKYFKYGIRYLNTHNQHLNTNIDIWIHTINIRPRTIIFSIKARWTFWM